MDPWQLQMNQLSRGCLKASFAVTQVNGILLTREVWSRRIAATGLTPQGYVVLAGACEGDSFSWCDLQTGSHSVAYAFDATEIDFVVPAADDHWVMLIPVALLDDYLGAELAADLLPKAYMLQGDPRRVSELSLLVQRTISLIEANEVFGTNLLDLELLETHLLEAAVGFILHSERAQLDAGRAKQRFQAYQSVRSILDTSRDQPDIQKLAKEAGVSRRSLELAFREAMAVSPQLYSRLVRLNGLRRELSSASPRALTVKAVAQQWGFKEFGRVAGYYRELFGETPRETLTRDERFCSMRLADALH